MTRSDCDLILQALGFARTTFENYPYPTPELRRERLDDVDRCASKVRAMRREVSQ
jgi:hypothetical protein